VAEEKKQLTELIGKPKTQVDLSDALLQEVGNLKSLQNSVTSLQQEFTDLLKDMISNKKQYDAIKRKIEDAAQVVETAATNAIKELEELKKLKLTKTVETSLSQQHLDLISNLSTSISTITSDLTALDEKVKIVKETPDPSIAKLTSNIATLETKLKQVTDGQGTTIDAKGVDALYYDSICDKLDLFQSKQEQELIDTFKEEAASRCLGVE
jgi:chromosome segregation ATPase